MACRTNYGIYDTEKKNYLNKVIDDTSGNTKEFYSLMKSATKHRRDTPDIMTHKGRQVKGQAKIAAMAEQLGSCFLKNVPSLGTNNLEIDESLLEIYETNFTDEKSSLWDNLNLKISLEEIKKMIQELKPKKDPVP